ncbi:MAG TPA: hypothetical protein VGV59_09955 [Pyrinomonadaceae bacterium]|nr:hypothetical protein [Pyrinomonadaceae bacterium]
MERLMRAGQIALLLLCVAGCGAVARADVKIKSRQTTRSQTSSSQTHENTTYIKGKRQRSEQMGGQMISIQQCDLRRDIQIMPQMKSYMIRPYDTDNAASVNASSAIAQPGTSKKGGVVTSTVTTRDTGERKQMFGYTARRIITTIETKSSPDACTPMNSKMETDGWYIDAAFVLQCDMERANAYRIPQQRGGCQDRYESKQVGAAKRGYPVWEKMTMYDEAGQESFSTVNEVVELSQATLDAALFDVPADYREVKDFSAASLMASASDGSDDRDTAGAASASPSDSGMSVNVRSMANTQPSQAASPLGAKRPGVVRLGIAAVKTGSVGEGLSAADLAAAVQNTLAEYLKTPTVELVQLEAKLPSLVEAEAKQKECDFIVFANVSHKKGGGGGFGGMFGKVVAPAVGQVGIGHTGSTAGNVAGQVATRAVVNAGDVSANVKQKDELTLDLRVQAPGSGSPAASKQFKSKAKSAGEDIITPVVEQAAQTILDAAKL